MVNHLLETSPPLSSSAPPLTVPAPHPSSILRTHFQVPYPVSPLLATLTKTPGGCGVFFPFWFTQNDLCEGNSFLFPFNISRLRFFYVSAFFPISLHRYL